MIYDYDKVITKFTEGKLRVKKTPLKNESLFFFGWCKEGNCAFLNGTTWSTRRNYRIINSRTGFKLSRNYQCHPIPSNTMTHDLHVVTFEDG